MILRQIKCDVAACSVVLTEHEPNAGFPGWGALHGVMMNGSVNPNLCPACLAKVAEFMDKLPGE